MAQKKFNLNRFEADLREQYMIMNELDFLGDGTVWYEKLAQRMVELQGYTMIQIEEGIRLLKHQKLGMITMNRGKDKTWIEVKAGY